MHVLAVVLLFYLGAFYLVQGGMGALAGGMAFLACGLFLWKGYEKKAIIPICGLLLALLAIGGYPSNQIPSRVRVTGIYASQVLVQNGPRRYVMENVSEDLEVGMVLLGSFRMERMEKNRRGQIAVLHPERLDAKKDIVTVLHAWKKRMQQQLIQRYGFDQGTLVTSLVIGLKDQLGEERATDMKALGIMHILSISGFHFALIEDALKRMRFGRWVFPIIVCYALLVGTVSAHRVLLYSLWKRGGRFFKRDVDAVTSLSTAMLVQSMWMPYLLFDIGFLLTYLSTFGILIFYPFLEQKYLHYPRWIVLPCCLTISALALSLPVILMFQEGISVGLLVGAVLLMPIYGIVTYLSFLTVVLHRAPVLLFFMEPFRNAFFDLSYHLGSFFGEAAFIIPLAHLKFFYGPILLFVILSLRLDLKQLLLGFLILVLLSGMPLFTTLSYRNKYGKPIIRVTHGMKLYDIMDYRVADGKVLALRKKAELKLKDFRVEVSPGVKPRDLPVVRINGRELRTERYYPYYQGMKTERLYIFIGERMYRIR